MFDTQSLVYILLSVICVSYGWGMRGTLCGGEQGALLPGAFMGYLFAVFSPSPVISQNILIFTCVGACSMFFGGDMTYGQTLGLCLYNQGKPPPAYKKGMTAVFLKGGLWFGVTAAFLGIAVGTMDGTYSWRHILLLFILMPVFRYAFYWFFNKPLNVQQNKFPAVYFSTTRQESWGGMLGIFILLSLFCVWFSDIYTLKLICFGFTGGAVGWVCSLAAFSITTRKLKNGKYLFGWFQANGFIGNWKLMECMLGAFGGLFFSVGAVITRHHVTALTVKVPNAADMYPALFRCLPWIIVVLTALDLSQHLFRKKPNRNLLESNFSDGLISRKEYERRLQCMNQAGYGAFLKKTEKFYELTERPAYAYAPLILALLGSRQAANLTVVFILFTIAAERLCADRLTNIKAKVPLGIFFTIVALGTLIVGEWILPDGYSNLTVWLFLCIEYEALQLYNDFRPSKVRRLMKRCGNIKKYLFSIGSVLTMHLYYLLLLSEMLKYGIKNFR